MSECFNSPPFSSSPLPSFQLETDTLEELRRIRCLSDELDPEGPRIRRIEQVDFACSESYYCLSAHSYFFKITCTPKWKHEGSPFRRSVSVELKYCINRSTWIIVWCFLTYKDLDRFLGFNPEKSKEFHAFCDECRSYAVTHLHRTLSCEKKCNSVESEKKTVLQFMKEMNRVNVQSK